jgi:hypothetical protein
MPGAFSLLHPLIRRDIQLIPVTLSLGHDDGVKSRHLSVTIELPAVPRSGERIRAGGRGSYLTVDQVLWDERDVTAILDPVRTPEHQLPDLLDNGWRVLSEWASVPAVVPARELERSTRVRSRAQLRVRS